MGCVHNLDCLYSYRFVFSRGVSRLIRRQICTIRRIEMRRQICFGEGRSPETAARRLAYSKAVSDVEREHLQSSHRSFLEDEQSLTQSLRAGITNWTGDE